MHMGLMGDAGDEDDWRQVCAGACDVGQLEERVEAMAGVTMCRNEVPVLVALWIFFCEK